MFSFAWTVYGKTAWEERLISKFITSQSGIQTITTYILPNISRSKGNQKMRLGQLIIEHNLRIIILQKLCRKWGRETSSRSLFVFQKSFIRGKSKWFEP